MATTAPPGVSTALHCTSFSKQFLFMGNPRRTLNISSWSSQPLTSSIYPSLYNCHPDKSACSAVPRKNNKKQIARNVEVADDIDEDAIEALFSQLEEDLKNDEMYGVEDEEDMSEEELVKLEQELAEALEYDETFEALGSTAHGEIRNVDDDLYEDGDGYDVCDDSEEEEEKPIKLKNWQLRRLAYALKDGRRKTRIKNLAADLCLDRDVVLKLLRDPPPNLVMLSATLPNKPVPTMIAPVEKIVETIPFEEKIQAANPELEAKVPVHVMERNWSAQKRLKKVQVRTLELVYGRTKRPTNAMISSIVHVTNLPWRRVVKWFEDKRAEEGVPERRLPYQASIPNSPHAS